MVATLTFVADTITPVRAYAALRRAAGDAASFLLESVVGGERWGRYSILGYRPRHEMTLLANGQWVDARRSAREGAAGAADPLEAARAMFEPVDGPSRGDGTAARFAQTYVGYLAWDLVHSIEKVPGWGAQATAPLGRFFGGSTIVVFDGLSHTITIAADDAGDVERARTHLEDATPLAPLALPDRAKLPADVTVDVDDATYEAKVRRAQEYIAAGDAFQIVVARTFRVPRGRRDPFDVYRAMRVLNPSPYMYFLDLPPAPGERTRTQIAGASPETMVHLENRAMTLRPIAGTTRRGKTPEEDADLERELLADPKERAEHVMLIDLGRNDVGRVAEVGSVRVVRQMEIERYSHVMHIVSEVTGRIPIVDAASRGRPRRVPRRDALRRAEGSGDADHPRARGRPPRHLRRRDRLCRQDRRPRFRHRDPHGRLQGRHLLRDRRSRHRRGQRPGERGRGDAEQGAQRPLRHRDRRPLGIAHRLVRPSATPRPESGARSLFWGGLPDSETAVHAARSSTLRGRLPQTVPPAPKQGFEHPPPGALRFCRCMTRCVS